jgi:hypothetical protein
MLPIQVAAEDILALSMDVPTTDKPGNNFLEWFAELAVSGIDDHGKWRSKFASAIPVTMMI